MLTSFWWKRFIARVSWSRMTRRSRGRGVRVEPSARSVPRRLSFERLEDRTLLATLTVNSLADGVTAMDGLVTLREAVIAANTNTATDLGQTGAAGLDMIVFQAGLAGTILLTAGEMDVTEDLTITGRGQANTSIDAQFGSRIFDVSGVDTDLTLEGLTLQSGQAAGAGGGAIRSLASGTSTIAISHSTLSGNSTTGFGSVGGAIYAQSGAVTVTSSMLSGNSTAGDYAHGGAIFTQNGDVTVTTSTLAGNSTAGTSAQGGAITAFYGAATVNSSTLSGNSTTGSEAFGGAISSPMGGNVTIISSTLSGNSVANGGFFGGGALYFDNGDALIVHSTITNNSATIGGGIGIYNDNNGESLTIINSIIAGNTAATNPDFTAPGGTPGTLLVRNSLIGDNQGTSLAEAQTVNLNGNFIGQSVVNMGTGIIAPMLDALANNGGPTETHALLVGSLALNSGDNTRATIDGMVGGAALSTDQRGAPFVRTFGGTVDMGAFERQTLPAALFVVDTAVDEDDGDYSVGDRALREMIDLANASIGQDVITFATTLNMTPLLLSLGGIAITESVIITGNGQMQTIIDAQDQSRIFYITGSGDVLISGVTLQRGDGSHDGGAVLVDSTGTLTISNSLLTLNSTDGSGGALCIENGNVRILNSTLTGNTAGNGGALYLDHGTVTVDSSTLTNNHATGVDADGGAIYHDAGTLILRSVTISGNTAVDRGGAIRTYTHDALTRLEIYDSTIEGNSATSGGGLFFDRNATLDSSLVIYRSTISGNSATSSGGGLYIYSGTAFLANVTLSGNTAGEVGAGLLVSDNAHYDTSLTAVNVTITGNRANDNDSVTSTFGDVGGGIFLVDDPLITVTLNNTIVAGNFFGLAAPVASDIVGEGTKTLAAASANNLIGDPGTAGGLMDAANGNIVGQGGLPVAISNLLAPLANNGGPTQTHALVAGSLALNSGSDALALDDLGNPLSSDGRTAPFHRVFGGTVDIGAFEDQVLQTIINGTAFFVGTAGADGFTYNTATSVVRFNTEPAYVLPGFITFVNIDGRGSRDVLSLLGSAGSDAAVMRPGSVAFDFNPSHAGFDVSGVDLEVILLHGQGGSDVVTMLDSAGDDSFHARPNSAAMFNAQYSLEAFGYGVVSAVMTSGNDLARLIDSVGDDLVVAAPGHVTVSGPGFLRSVQGFDTLVASSTEGGVDVGKLIGTAGVDVLQFGPGSAALGGTGYSLQLQAFETVQVTGLGGLDTAFLNGSPGNDTLIAAPTSATFSGVGFSLSLLGFESLRASSDVGANDIADLTETAGNDSFVGGGGTGEISGLGFYVQATGFDTIRIRGVNGGTNRRFLTQPLGFSLVQFGTWV